ncbi:MAG: hypothetical protein ACP5LS_05810 [Thermoprotei archaeon]
MKISPSHGLAAHSLALGLISRAIDAKRGHLFAATIIVCILTTMAPSAPSIQGFSYGSQGPRLTQLSRPAMPSDPASYPVEAYLSMPSPEYDVQIGESFTQSFTNMTWFITAVAQNGSYGYGPAYLVNGLSNTGYWYQVGLAYNWPYEGGGYHPGFGMIYEVFSPSGSSIFPTSRGGGWASLSGPVNPGDVVCVSLYFWPVQSVVVMSVYDENTRASAIEMYSDEGASEFVPMVSQVSSNGFFTGIMTEEYHVNPFYGEEKAVTYFEHDHKISSAWLWADERDDVNHQAVYFDSTASPVNLSSWLYPFWGNGYLIYANSTSLITGYPSSPPPLGLTSFWSENLTLDSGRAASASFEGSLSGGAPPYFYCVYLDGKAFMSGQISSESFGSGILAANLSVGKHAFQVCVNDSRGQRVMSPIYYVTVNPPPFLSIGGKTVYDVGQLLNLSISVEGGTPPYAVSFYVNGTQRENPVILTSVGNASVYASLLDSSGGTARSNVVYIRVNQDPSASITYSSKATDANLPVYFNATVSGGSPPYFYRWWINGSVQAYRGASFAFTPVRAGLYNVSSLIEDSTGFKMSGNIYVRVFPDPFISRTSVTTSFNLLYLPSQAALSVNVSGGEPPYQYDWYLNGRLVARTTSGTYSYQLTPGTNYLEVKVTDSAGYVVNARTLTVVCSYNIYSIAAAVILVAALALLLRAKKTSRQTRGS